MLLSASLSASDKQAHFSQSLILLVPQQWGSGKSSNDLKPSLVRQSENYCGQLPPSQVKKMTLFV